MAEWFDDCWKSQEWRLNHLYWIERKEGAPCRFRLNWAQKELHENLWHRNNILKARQLGISTYTSMLILDMCLFHDHFHAGIIDKSLPDAKEKLAKILFAYECLGEPPLRCEDYVTDEGDRERIRSFARGIYEQTKGEFKELRAEFATGSDVRIGTNLRGGTLQLLHVSEFGYVSINDPKKALKVLSGGVNTVGRDGCVIMESTHEGGKYGQNYRLTKEAMDNVGKNLNVLDFRFFFFPWWKQAEYSVSGSDVVPNKQQSEYFEGLESQGIKLDDGQKRWYLSQWRTFGHLVKQEYPSTPAEAFETQVDGAIYGAIISELRAEGRMSAEFEGDEDLPLFVSWDLGMSDHMSMWLIQCGVDGKYLIHDHYTGSGKELNHYVGVVRQWEARHGQSIATHLLPHDAAKRDWDLTSFDQRLAKMGMVCRVVPRVADIWTGIGFTRKLLRHCVFHKRCNEPVKCDGEEYMSGVNALENYQTVPVGANGRIQNQPLHNECSHSADAFRTFAEAQAHGLIGKHHVVNLTQEMHGRKGMARGVPWAR